jgi:hypothetical protein
MDSNHIVFEIQAVQVHATGLLGFYRLHAVRILVTLFYGTEISGGVSNMHTHDFWIVFLKTCEESNAYYILPQILSFQFYIGLLQWF